MDLDKQKTSGLRALWQWATAAKEFEFTSPYTSEECVRILEERSERGKGNGWLKHSRSRLLIRVDSTPKNTREFYMHRDAGRNLNAEVIGTLQSKGSTTLVQGYGQIGAFTTNFSIMFLGIGTVMVAILTVALVVSVGLIGLFVPFTLILPVGVIFILLQISARERDQLIRLIEEILGAST